MEKNTVNLYLEYWIGIPRNSKKFSVFSSAGKESFMYPICIYRQGDESFEKREDYKIRDAETPED